MADPKRTEVQESLEGATVFNLPLPRDPAALDGLPPLVVKSSYAVDYIHSYGQDSPFFAGLTQRRLLGTRCTSCGHVFATPKKSCMECGGDCQWVDLPQEARVHAFTVCHMGSEEFLPECPYVLALLEFEGVDTLFLARLKGVDASSPSLDWIGLKVRARFRRLARLKPTDVWFEPA